MHDPAVRALAVGIAAHLIVARSDDASAAQGDILLRGAGLSRTDVDRATWMLHVGAEGLEAAERRVGDVLVALRTSEVVVDQIEVFSRVTDRSRAEVADAAWNQGWCDVLLGRDALPTKDADVYVAGRHACERVIAVFDLGRQVERELAALLPQHGG